MANMSGQMVKYSKYYCHHDKYKYGDDDHDDDKNDNTDHGNNVNDNDTT